jgi:PAS domain S-box-containing protein
MSSTFSVRDASAAQAILVVEDNPASRKLMRVTLESEGHAVHEAPDARSALDWLRDHHPRLILQDLVLPDLDGLELLAKIRELPHGRAVPVLCLSGFIARMDEARALTDGFAALLAKPVDPIQLLDTVRQHLARVGPYTEPQHPSDKRVFVIDNDPLQRQLAEYHLGAAGFSVTTFASAQTALSSAEAEPPSAIICSLLAEGMGGFELCLRLRQADNLDDVRVILVSSQPTEPEDHELALQLGADTLACDGGDWANLLEILRKVPSDRPRRNLWLQVSTAREAILRRTQAQLDRQLRANALLGQRCMLQNAQLSVLAGLADSLTREPTRKDALSDVLAVCLDLAGIAKGALYLREDAALVPRYALGFDAAAESSALADFFGHAPELDQIIHRGQAVSIPSAAMSGADAQDFLRRAGLCSALIVPVAFRDRCYGALLLGASDADLSSHEPLAFARVLGGQVGLAIGLSDAFERLHASEERFRNLVESMESVTVVDREQRVTGAYGSDQVSPQDFVGKPLEHLLGEPQTQAQHDAYARALSGQSVVYEWTRGTGQTARHFRDALWPVRDAAGEVKSVMRVGRDVTEEKRVQAQGMMTNRMASVGMLAAGIAHEINNPLMAVLGNLQLVLDSLPRPSDSERENEQALSLRDAYDAAKRVESIVRDLRLFSRSDADNRSAVDVHSLLNSTLRMARAALRHRARVVKAYSEIPDVLANEPRLGQVFLNLIINAAQALPDNASDTEEIRISTGIDGAGRVRVEISDTGCGIPEELARRLFTPFLTTKPAGVGTGLGLVICQRIVSSLKGEISFESKVGAGTTFRVLLPAAKPSPRSLPVRPASQPVPGRGRVVIVDDEALVGNLLTKALGRDHSTYTFADAREALVHLKAHPEVDVILCDLVMPDMSGMEFYEALVQTVPTLSARVIFLTGGAFTQTMLEFLERVPNLHLRKPLNISELRAVVNERVG